MALKELQKNRDDNQSYQSKEDKEVETRCQELRCENAWLRIESAQVDQQLDASREETEHLRGILQQEQEVQALREQVAAQRVWGAER